MLVLAAVVLRAAAFVPIIMMPVMIAHYLRVVVEFIVDQRVYRVVRAARYSAVELYPCSVQSVLRAAAYAAADEGINAQTRQKSR